MYEKYVKRLLDLFFCILAFPFWILILIFISVAIKLDDGGPVFYLSKRIGKNCRIINMYKFRTMKVNAPNILNKDGSTYNSKSDPRVTRVGKFLRETSLDETAQIINIFIGNMSFIGPRASGAEALQSYKDDEKDKMKVIPGITGLTQAYYRNAMSLRQKRLKDAWYANNVSFLLDLKILFKTITTVFKRENIYTNPDNTDIEMEQK